MSDLIPGEGELAALGGGSSPGLVWNDETLDDTVASMGGLRPVCSTGLPRLDAILGGGLAPGLHVLAGQPGSGKTTLLTQLADATARLSGRRALLVTLEMSPAALLVKTLVRLSREIRPERPLAPSEVCALGSGLDSEPSRAELFASSVAACRRYIAPRLCTTAALRTPESIDAALAALPPDMMPPVLFLDYLQLLHPADPAAASGSDLAALNAVIDGLCRIASEHAVPVMVLAAQNRQRAKGAAKDFSSLAGSSAIEYSASSVSFLSVDEVEVDRPFARRVSLHVAKSRGGPCGRIDLTFFPQSCLFEEAA